MTQGELKAYISSPDHYAIRIRDIVEKYQIVCYGAGSGLDTFSSFILNKFNIKIKAVLDRRYDEPIVENGVLYCDPKDFDISDDEQKQLLAVVTVGKKEYHKEILQTLNAFGFENTILASDIYEYHLHYIRVEEIEKGLDYYRGYLEEIEVASELFEDNESSEVYRSILNIYLMQQGIEVPHHAYSEQYFPEDIEFSKGYGCFINCGAYDGDTIRQLVKKTGKINMLVCFEPEMENFKRLSEYLVSEQYCIADTIIALPCGVHDSARQLYFESGCSVNSAISESGDTLIQCISLDEMLHGLGPTFIQMDIEGAEPEALNGAIRTIKASQCDLAISVYHEPSHLWRIPLFIHALNSKYRFYLRNYSGGVTDTVLYAVCREDGNE
jgi:FkbM family methyltransferase